MAATKDDIIELRIALPSSFKLQLQDAMEEEFEVASRKWEVDLSLETKKQIFANALRQLEAIVKSVTGREWRPEAKQLVVEVKNPKPGFFAIDLPSEAAAKHSVAFVRSHEGWKVNQDPNMEAVELQDFKQFMEEQLKTWARTAVFYGVGSYN